MPLSSGKLIAIIAALGIAACDSATAPKRAPVSWTAQRSVVGAELRDVEDRILTSTDPAVQQLRGAFSALHQELPTADDQTLSAWTARGNEALEIYERSAPDSIRLDEADLDVLRLALSHAEHLSDVPIQTSVSQAADLRR